ncbi:MAG: DNA cytosine methyltransferase [Reyranellaceae bacterium]
MAGSRRPIAVELFAGAGGTSLGFEQAGFDVAAAVEIDPIHAAVHSFNFPRCATLARSVVGLTGRQIREAAGLGDVPVDVVVGGAPCQGFSLIGHRVLDDPRNRLVLDFVRIVAELDARYFVFENVKGLTVGAHKQFLIELIEAFKERGYNVTLPWSVLNAAHYGVPQDRQRLILMGAKKGLRLPEYPRPHTSIPAERRPPALDLPRVTTCAEALADLPNADDFEGLWQKDETSVQDWSPALSKYAREMRCLSNDAWHFGHPRVWDPSILTASMRTQHTDISRRRFDATPGGEVEPISRFFRLAADGIANTLRAGTDGARGAFTSPRPIHYQHARCITVREMARLHGFPDWFRFHVTKWHGARQIGNAVAPPMARSIAAQVMKAVGLRPTRPREALALGDPHLLAMNMAEAAAHFGVDVPITRRDRKSGAKKRKQWEIEALIAAE